ncbi:MAG: hypothetical protein ABIU54_03570 [Candidatus Eisenbacteria bacterium]
MRTLGAMRWPLLAFACVCFATASAEAITLDGQLDVGYDGPIAMQVTATIMGDNARGKIDYSDGSELDALYTKLVDGTLYLFFTGDQVWSQNTDPGFFANHLNLFFDTRAGGQAVVRGDNFDVGQFPGYDALAHLAGLTLESGFEADYWFGTIPTGQPNWGLGPFHYNAWTAELLTAGGGPGSYLGWTGAGASPGLTEGSNPFGVRVSIDNSNGAGVPSGCAPASGAGVITGIEWAIPLAALGNPTECVTLVAFMGSKGNLMIGNQMLPPLPIGSCSWIAPDALNLAAIAGVQAVTICGTGTPTRRSTWGAIKTRYH